MATLSKFDAQHARRRDGHEQEVGIAENYLQGFHEGVSGLMGGARLSEAVIGLPQHLQLARLVFRFVLCCARRYAQRGMQKVAADVAPAREPHRRRHTGARQLVQEGIDPLARRAVVQPARGVVRDEVDLEVLAAEQLRERLGLVGPVAGVGALKLQVGGAELLQQLVFIGFGKAEVHGEGSWGSRS